MFLAALVRVMGVVAWSCPTYFVAAGSDLCRFNGPYPMKGSVVEQPKTVSDLASVKSQQPLHGEELPLRSISGSWRTLPYIAQLDQGLNRREIEIGKELFFSKDISRDRNLSCADCHRPDRGFTDQKPLATNSVGKSLRRNTPTLVNMVFQESFFWDGRAKSAQNQVEGPLFSDDEMAMTPALLLERIMESPRLFHALKRLTPTKSLEDSKAWVTRAVAQALVTYQATLISFDSPFDRWFLGQKNALSQEEQEGFKVFRSFVTRCAECHIPPLFTSNQLAVIGAPNHPKIGEDLGAFGWHPHPLLRGAFKVPTLRNVALTAPYMHGGVFSSLPQVIQFYDRGGGRAPFTRKPAGLHWHIRPMGLSVKEKSSLTRFLGALTEVNFQPVSKERF